MSASTTIPERMTAEEFIDWAEQRPDEHFELCDGVVIEKTAERAVHGTVKTGVAARMIAAVEAAALPCEVFCGEMAVRVSDHGVFEPDVVVRCGEPIEPDLRYLTDPLIVVEINSPSNSRVDKEKKFAAYYATSSLRHHLTVDATARRIVHHARREYGPFQTTLLGDGPIQLDPPGLVICNLFAPA